MQLDWCLYKRSLDDTTVEIEDYEQIFIATQEGEILIEEVIDDYLRLTNEEKQAEELVKENQPCLDRCATKPTRPPRLGSLVETGESTRRLTLGDTR